MNTIYTLEEGKEATSIFLAGPTVRHNDKKYETISWRNEAIKLLEQQGFDGDVYIPEFRTNYIPELTINKPDGWTYSKQIDWETKMLAKATVILFWIPRDLEILPGFTTNIEFGEWFKSNKIVIGAPEDAPKNGYLKERCNRLKIAWQNSLASCVDSAINKLQELRGASCKTWFTADTHFGHQRTLELSRRPFKTADEMSWEIAKKWNSIVSDNDTVFHLGDFGDPKYLSHLRGKKIFFLPGNYDNEEIVGAIKKDERVTCIGLNDVTTLNGKEVSLVHSPDQANNSSDFYLFGHIHRLQMVKRNGLNVGVDCHDFKPIDIETVLFYREAILKHYDKNVFMETMGEQK